MNCGTCKHWRHEEGSAYGVCNAVKHGNMHIAESEIDEARKKVADPSYDSWCGLCDTLEEALELLEKANAQGPAHVVDGSGYHAALKCEDSFGCVLHEYAS